LNGLYYNRFRYYDSTTGLYISKDPIGLAWNNPTMYAYVWDSNGQVDVFGMAIWDDLGMDFKTWFDQAFVKDVENKIKDVTSKRGLRYKGGKHELFPVSLAPVAKELVFLATELEKMAIETDRVTFINILDKDREELLPSGKHHKSKASSHFHIKLMEDLSAAKNKGEAKRIIAEHHKNQIRLDYK